MTPEVPVAHWGLDELHVLDERAFVGRAPLAGAGSFTAAFWFQASVWRGLQVIANQGCTADHPPGWSAFLDDARLVFQVVFDDGRALRAEVACSASDWQHAALVFDREAAQLRGYLNGSPDGWRASDPIGVWGSLTLPPEVRLGGYTDPAGGHFDHTFGRNASGYVDDFRLYDRPLSAQAIQQLAHAGQAAPVACFSAEPAGGAAPITVQFDARSSAAPGGVRAYLWDFGDGQRGYGAVVSHDYAYAGRATVRLTVLDAGYAQAAAEQTLIFSGRENPLRVTPVFVNGAEGYACYRIPSIVRALNGDLIAFAEGRVASCSDSTPVIRIVCKRSADRGQTWRPLQVIARNEMDGQEYAAQNPSPVVDVVHGSGRIILLLTLAEHSEWDLARGIGFSRTHCVISDDHGASWSAPRDITPQVHRPFNPPAAARYPYAALEANRDADWRIQRPTLGHAIQLSAGPFQGRLVHAGMFTAGDRSVFESQNYLFWSDDLGESWQMGGVIPQIGLNEATLVELEDGAVLVNSRSYREGRPLGRRSVTVCAFDAESRVRIGDTRPDPALVDSGVQASLIRYTFRAQAEWGGRSRILFSNPSSPHARRGLTVRLSYDEGQTWPVSKLVDPGPSSYSDLVIQDDMRVGVLYEQGNQGGIAYVNFSLDWLTDGQDKLELPESR